MHNGDCEWDWNWDWTWYLAAAWKPNAEHGECAAQIRYKLVNWLRQLLGTLGLWEVGGKFVTWHQQFVIKHFDNNLPWLCLCVSTIFYLLLFHFLCFFFFCFVIRLFAFLFGLGVGWKLLWQVIYIKDKWNTRRWDYGALLTILISLCEGGRRRRGERERKTERPVSLLWM